MKLNMHDHMGDMLDLAADGLADDDKDGPVERAGLKEFYSAGGGLQRPVIVF